MIFNRKQAVVQALGKIETVKYDIRTLSSAVSEAPLWRPGTGLKKQYDQTLAIIEDLEARFDRQLVVTIIGPCGSGKSTLLNALAGIDDISTTGVNRPTTRKVIVFCRQAADADLMVEKIGLDKLEIRPSPSAENLRHVILVDTPDTDSVEQQAHIPIVHSAVMLSDVLICVFNGENPKTRDHVDFFAPYIRRFDGESLVAVMNRCDRLDERELKERILPDFEDYLSAAWEKPVQKILCVSARRNLKTPGWTEGAGPRHDYDQFDDLHRMIFNSFNQGGFVVDRRVENAENMKRNLGLETVKEVENVRQQLSDARKAIGEAETRGMEETVSALISDGSNRFSGVNALLYQKLADRWVGPVGWLIAIWARLLGFAGGILATVRSGIPFRRFLGPAHLLGHLHDTSKTGVNSGRTDMSDAVLRKYRLAVLKCWPDIAETLIDCRFDGSVRKIENALPEGETLKMELDALWRESMETAVEGTSRRLGGWLMQILFNLPTVGILIHVGWTTVRNYFTGNYLPSNYFVHAGLIIMIAMFLSFFLFQVCVRLWGGSDRMIRRAAERVKQQVEHLKPLTTSPVARQVEAVLGLVPVEIVHNSEQSPEL